MLSALIDKLYELRLRDESFKEKLKKPFKEFIDAPRWKKPNSNDEGLGVLISDKSGESDRLKLDFLAVLHKEGKIDEKIPEFNAYELDGMALLKRYVYSRMTTIIMT